VADGRHFEKPLNRHNSATVRLIAVKFGMTTHFDPPMPSDGQNFDFLNIQHGGRPMPGMSAVDTLITAPARCGRRLT